PPLTGCDSTTHPSLHGAYAREMEMRAGPRTTNVRPRLRRGIRRRAAWAPGRAPALARNRRAAADGRDRRAAARGLAATRAAVRRISCGTARGLVRRRRTVTTTRRTTRGTARIA